MWVLLLFFASSVILILAQNEDITCSPSYCDAKYVDDDGESTCLAMPRNCNIQNATHNGLFLPFPGPCSCCDYCLSNIGEGVECGVGSPSSPTPTSICGDGLSCNVDEGTTCQRLNTACTRAQDEYDGKRQSGTLGHLETRPSCNRNGDYEPYKCIPGEICYCVSEKGERIFGEMEYSEDVSELLKCECSRNYNAAVELIGSELNPKQHLHCRWNGDFDELQCIKNDCYCVNSVNGNPENSNMRPVNMSDISTLPCCKLKNMRQMVRLKFNQRLVNETIHDKGSYYKDCEALYIQNLEEIERYEADGFEIFGFNFPNCQLDGFYAPVQFNLTSKYCANPQGNILENFIVDITSDLSNTMNCKCARARSLITSDEKPECCQNGNYASVQCRRGLCRCVNSDGNQMSKEVDHSLKETLECYNSCTTN